MAPDTRVVEQSRITIDTVQPDERSLTVDWNDGRVSRFHHIWLRDNCTCEECGTTETGGRYLELLDIPEDVAPQQVRVDDGVLAIRWHPDGHQSRYEPAWLRQHCYSTDGLSKGRRAWGAEIMQDLPHLRYSEVANHEESCIELVEQIYRDGFARLSDVETTREGTLRMAEMIGPVKGYTYPPTSEIVFDPQAPASMRDPVGQKLANIGTALVPHVDEGFRSNQPGLVVLHCVKPAAAGGGATILVDGFKAATLLREQNPGAFELLCRTPIAFRRRIDGEFDHYMERPHISLDASGEVNRVCIWEKSTAPLQAPEHLIEPLYAARRALLSLTHEEGLQANFMLGPGDALIIDNHRVMHARTAYHGARHLRHCHIDHDEMFSRYRMACRRLGRNPRF